MPANHLSREERARRTPPGQTLTDKFPVLTYGETPRFDPATWDFRLFGLIEEPVRWSYDEFRALPQTRVLADFHCVTTWSRLDNTWEGVHIREVLRRVRLKPETKVAMVHCDGGYTTNVTLDVLADDDVLLAHRLDGEDISLEHGFPLRLIVPKRYAWKSAKWVRGIEFIAQNRPGFWERHGYHMDGDPWTEERYG